MYLHVTVCRRQPGPGYKRSVTKAARKHAQFNQPETKTLSEILVLELMRMASYLFCGFVADVYVVRRKGMFSVVCVCLSTTGAYPTVHWDWSGSILQEGLVRKEGRHHQERLLRKEAPPPPQLRLGMGFPHPIQT